MRIPAFLAAGIASSSNLEQALWPALVGDLPREGERKKFCMSIITRAVLAGEKVMGEVVVCMVKVPLVGWGVSWVGGWVRSKPVEEECSQKLDLEPNMALRPGFEVVGSLMVLERVVGVLRRVVGGAGDVCDSC